MQADHEQLLKRFNLSGPERSILTAGGKQAIPLLPQVLDDFYSFVGQDTEMVAFFKNKEMMEMAKAAQQKHWTLLLEGGFDQTYFASARKIGLIHPKIGLPFVFFLSGYAQASSRLQELLMQRGRRFGGQRINPAELSALTRAFALDTHLILDAHFTAESEEQQTAFAHLTKGIEKLAARDLSHFIPAPGKSDFPERFNTVRETFNSAVDSLRDAIGSIQSSAGNLNGNANEVAQAAEDLSRRTESQAATLEQTAAAVEEISVSMSSSAEATAQTNQSVGETRSKAEQTSGVVAKAVEKMQEIEQHSNQIAQIISVIDDISFQTNLLALNAGVEAARAGESGRGFAVVASEVRALAQRTADSANEIKTLIKVSSGHVEDGVELVGRAGEALSDMLTDINRAAELTTNVATASDQQASGFSEINIGVSQLDQVTQQNAAMVEETTAAALSMRQEAQSLAELLASFQVAAATARNAATLARAS